MPGEFHEAQFGYYPIANSQWLREDATEAPVGEVAVPKTGRGIGQRPVLNLFSTDSPDDDACQWKGSED